MSRGLFEDFARQVFGARIAQKSGGDPVDGRLAPTGALDDEDMPPVFDQRFNRSQLVVAQGGVGQRAGGLSSTRQPG